jgi:hypothetical protein
MSLRMFAIIFCVLWIGAILLWSDPPDVPMVAGILTALAWFCVMGVWLGTPAAN